MKKTEAFIEDRIRWRASLHGLPKDNTYFWESGKNAHKISLPLPIGKPILVSAANESHFVVICTRGAAVKNGSLESSLLYSEIDQVRDLPMKCGELKEELTTLVIKLANGNEISIAPEPFSPAFSVDFPS